MPKRAKEQNANLRGMGGVFNAPNLNLYAYAHSNPVRYSDPDGESASDALFELDRMASAFPGGRAIKALLFVGSAAIAGHQMAQNNQSDNKPFVPGSDIPDIPFSTPANPPPEDPDGDNSGSSSTKGLSEDARFAQRNYSEKFSEKGAEELTKIVGRPINTIDDLANAIRSGEVSPSKIPVNTINRGGNTLMLNTRSVQALQRAGVPRSEFNVINRTGQPRFEKMLNDQLRRSNLSNEGIRNVVPRD